MRAACQGFHLLELVVVLAFVSLLAALALPLTPRAQAAHELEQAARLLAADLQLARVRALARGRPVRVSVGMRSGTWERFVEVAGGSVPDGRPGRLPPSVRFDPAESNRVEAGFVHVVFRPAGHTADNTTIVAKAEPGRRRVIVNPLGRVRVEP